MRLIIEQEFNLDEKFEKKFMKMEKYFYLISMYQMIEYEWWSCAMCTIRTNMWPAFVT